LTQEGLAKVFEEAVKVILFPKSGDSTSDSASPSPDTSDSTKSKKESSGKKKDKKDKGDKDKGDKEKDPNCVIQ